MPHHVTNSPSNVNSNNPYRYNTYNLNNSAIKIKNIENNAKPVNNINIVNDTNNNTNKANNINKGINNQKS